MIGVGFGDRGCDLMPRVWCWGTGLGDRDGV